MIFAMLSVIWSKVYCNFSRLSTKILHKFLYSELIRISTPFYGNKHCSQFSALSFSWTLHGKEGKEINKNFPILPLIIFKQ